MDRTSTACRACGAALAVAGRRCPACGYPVADHDRWRFLLGGLGTVLSLSVVLAPVGVPMLWRAHRHCVAAGGFVTGREGSNVCGRLRAVLRAHLGRAG